MTDQTLKTPSSSEDNMDFAALLDQDPISSKKLTGGVVKGTIIKIDQEAVLIDVGLKSEGRVPLREFSTSGVIPEFKIGDEVEVYLDRMENREGQVVLSYEKARREAAWVELEKSFQDNKHVNGVIFGRVKGGFTVDLNGAIAFLPGSQVDVRPIKDIAPLLGIDQPFQILKMDRARGNIVVSRRSIMEESRAEALDELMKTIKEGEVIEGAVKNITDYGAFIDLGGIDGLLHVTDMSWKRINHPSDVMEIGQTVKVRVIRFNQETKRVSLGMKQLEEDPWVGVETKYPVNSKLEGTVTNITDYGAFIELDDGIEGLSHVTDMSWTHKGVHPNQLTSVGQKVEVKVLDVDPDKRRIALGIKQCVANPWEKLQEDFSIGSEHEGRVKSITEFGLFVEMTDDIDGMVHLSDLSWDMSGDEALKQYKKGQTIKVKVLDIDPAKERVVLGVKQLMDDPFFSGIGQMKSGSVVTCEVTEIQEAGIEVTVGDGILGFIRKIEMAKDRKDRRSDRYAVGEKVDAKIIFIDRKARNLSLSVKAREVDEEKKVMQEYGSTDSGASLGDILGEAMSRAQERGSDNPDGDDDDKKGPKKSK
ncbi:MAG: 30S ribosomal protein S1 [Pseudomonadota bacterium]